MECRITNILRLPLRPLLLSPSSSLGGAERVLLDLISPWKIEVPEKQPQIVCIEDGPLIEILITNGFLPNLKKFPEKLLKLGDSPARLENLREHEGVHSKHCQRRDEAPADTKS